MESEQGTRDADEMQGISILQVGMMGRSEGQAEGSRSKVRGLFFWGTESISLWLEFSPPCLCPGSASIPLLMQKEGKVRRV